ncbi:MAG: hypothetical protein O2890_01355 [Cyanobacteria bacterium]|nr:hypothetical protein [Cyanobacteriota bacterium]MDA0865069.1 hypothetical protein [Cyanobacteriota bacterium]
MTVTFQVIILALLIPCILGIAIGYFMAQKQSQRQAAALQQQSQERFKALEAAHEQRLQEALFQARQDYESQLAQRIGDYQDQFSQNLAEREQEHQTRLAVWQQGLTTASAQSNPTNAGGTAVAAPPEVLQLKRQYEARLKEAAQKLQQACEQQLAQRAKATTADLQRAYETKLAQQIEQYEAKLAERVAQLESEFTARHDALTAEAALIEDVPAPPSTPPEFPQASPSEIMGTGNNDPTITLHRPFSPISAEPSSPPAVNPLDGDDSTPAPIPSALDRLDQDFGQPIAEKADEQAQLLSDLAELEEIPQLSTADLSLLDQLEDLSDGPQGEDAIEIEQLDPLDLDDISQLS